MAHTAVSKALTLLDILISEPEGFRPADLVRRTGYPSGTLHRLLATLVDGGFVRRDSATSKYVLGDKFLLAFNGMMRGMNLQQRVLPHLRRLAQATGHAANLGVLRGNQLMYLESIVADASGPVMYTPPGTVAMPHCTSMGKLLLAHLPDDELSHYLAVEPLPSRTPYSITDRATLASRLAHARTAGYAVDNEEYNLGVRCVAAPVEDHTGWVVAALSVSIPVHDAPSERIPTLVTQVMATAREVSRDLGYLPEESREATYAAG